MDAVYKQFEKKWLSRRAFFIHIIIPWIVISVLSYLIAVSGGDDSHAQFRRLLLVLFFSVYFLIVRIAMFIMAMNVHEQLKRKYKDAYAKRLEKQAGFGFIALKLGATLARIKRDLAHENGAYDEPTRRL